MKMLEILCLFEVSITKPIAVGGMTGESLAFHSLVLLFVTLCLPEVDGVSSLKGIELGITDGTFWRSHKQGWCWYAKR
jgi:hypothetical protein